MDKQVYWWLVALLKLKYIYHHWTSGTSKTGMSDILCLHNTFFLIHLNANSWLSFKAGHEKSELHIFSSAQISILSF